MLDQSKEESTIEQQLNASNSMLEELGVYQHHDAISGTAKQHVANDYSYRLSNALNQNAKAYGDLLSANATFEMCTRTNGTIYDCPTLKMSQESDEIFVALHNPSSLTLSQAQISVPSDQWLLYSLDDSENVDTDIMCFDVKILLDGSEKVV